MSGGTLKLKKKKQPLLCKLKGLSTFKNQDLMVFVNIHCCQLSLIFVLYFASVANLSLLASWYITFLGCWIAASVFFYTQQAHFFHSSLVGPLLTSSSPSVSPVVFWLISFLKTGQGFWSKCVWRWTEVRLFMCTFSREPKHCQPFSSFPKLCS